MPYYFYIYITFGLCIIFIHSQAKRMDVVWGETAGVEGQLLLLCPILFILQVTQVGGKKKLLYYSFHAVYLSIPMKVKDANGILKFTNFFAPGIWSICWLVTTTYSYCWCDPGVAGKSSLWTCFFDQMLLIIVKLFSSISFSRSSFVEYCLFWWQLVILQTHCRRLWLNPDSKQRWKEQGASRTYDHSLSRLNFITWKASLPRKCPRSNH